MRTAVFILCLAFSSSAYSGKCQNLVRGILNSTKNALTVAVMIPPAAHLMGKLMLIPQRELAARPGIEVVGSLISSRQTGEQIAKNVVDFDRVMESFGLKKSTPTKIIVFDRKILPNLIGPHHVMRNPFNLWHRSKADDIIVLQPGRGSHQIVKDPLVLFHERVHSILKKIYHLDSYIHNKPIQEGLSDFLTAHYQGTTILSILGGPHNIGKTPALPLPISSSPHDAGDAFSYTLWELQKYIGQEEIVALLKPFIDDLNQYYESFGERQGHNLLDKILKPEYEYFMAVLKKTLQEKSKTQEADEFISEIASELGLDIAVIDELAESITKSDKNF